MPKRLHGQAVPPPKRSIPQTLWNDMAMAGKKSGPQPREEQGDTLWSSFWEVTDPETAALSMVEFYGALASPAVTECMVTALTDERERDYQFWSAVLDEVGTIERARREAALALWAANGLETI